ncbi:hypothetical protein QTH97_32715 [Variovorax sp. J22R24]|uniref:hypothetical protein n=1 Tax=Variovorax gracilis TaxID=3053502 RepID=UPI002578F6B0|nr:hypothetical protein [Variovorax sp. J22R24]MDM0109720.1 hypothetical protein [Variovorax sp. J22R24]
MAPKAMVPEQWKTGAANELTPAVGLLMERDTPCLRTSFSIPWKSLRSAGLAMSGPSRRSSSISDSSIKLNVEDQARPGHWEGDLLFETPNSQIAASGIDRLNRQPTTTVGIAPSCAPRLASVQPSQRIADRDAFQSNVC